MNEQRKNIKPVHLSPEWVAHQKRLHDFPTEDALKKRFESLPSLQDQLRYVTLKMEELKQIEDADGLVRQSPIEHYLLKEYLEQQQRELRDLIPTALERGTAEASGDTEQQSVTVNLNKIEQQIIISGSEEGGVGQSHLNLA